MYFLINALLFLFYAAFGNCNDITILPRLDGKIVGGVPTSIDKHPHQISLQLYGSHICGASIISRKFIATAAHCTYKAKVENFKIRAGSSHHNTGGKVVGVANIYQHPKYSRGKSDYDISLLELQTELDFNNVIQAINLPEYMKVTPAGSPAVCTGWGALEEGGMSSNTLQEVSVNILGQDECERAYAKKGLNVTDRMICAGVPEGGKDSCQGDSGGPLVVNGELIGIVSWGYGCARQSFPGVYANVANLRLFISEIFNNNI